MDHPEKKLFDEIKQLKHSIEDLKHRVLKVESTYKQKVEEVEQREQQSIRSKNKLDFFLAQSSTYITLKNYRKEYRLTAATLTENIFKTKFLEEYNAGNRTMNLDIDTVYFEMLLRIIRLGHQIYFTQDQENLLNNILPNSSYKKNTDFIAYIKSQFDNKDFRRLSTLLSLNIKVIGENAIDCFLDFEVTGSWYDNLNIATCKAKSIKDLLNPLADDQKAIFINKDSTILIRLTEAVRTNGFYIRPFSMNKSHFNPTNGFNGSVSILISNNEADWECKGKIPQYDSTAPVTKFTEIRFKDYSTFKFIKFVTSTTPFSLAYIELFR